MQTTAKMPSGIPTEQQYKAALQAEKFQTLEKYSESFLSENAVALHDYAQKWVKDPLHQWSRQWEYPFVLDRLETLLSPSENQAVLDAGSGVTFFSYYLAKNYPNLAVHCCDYDESLGEIYSKINATTGQSVDFACVDLQSQSYADESFDSVYCISVLEHTENYGKIIDEFHRVLKPGGKLIVTFDLSIDGKRDISLERGEELLTALTAKFENDEEISCALNGPMNSADIFTTVSASKIDESLLPWKKPSLTKQITSMVSGKSWPPPLTFFCLSLRK